MDFPVTADRFIAYFDIMGFKDFIYRNNHDHVKIIIEAVSKTLETIERNERSDVIYKDYSTIKPIFFSDTILFITSSDSIYDVEKIDHAAGYFLHRMFTEKIPVKGAISHGKFTANTERSEFYGRPLVDAYELAEEIEFYGAVFHHSFEKRLNELDLIAPDNTMKRKKISTKKGTATHSFIDWRTRQERTEETWKNKVNDLYLSASGHIRKYVDNTLDAYSDSK